MDRRQIALGDHGAQGELLDLPAGRGRELADRIPEAGDLEPGQAGLAVLAQFGEDLGDIAVAWPQLNDGPHLLAPVLIRDTNYFDRVDGVDFEQQLRDL